MHKYLLLFLLILLCKSSIAQQPGSQFNMGGGRAGKSTDSIHFEHRDDAKDSVNISFRYLDSIRPIRFDSSISDFYKYFIVPAYQQFLGNDGAAGYPLIFSPYAKAGWDAGFHAYDAYKYTLENSRFFRTTRPFTQLIYQGFPAKEQVIKILHTQNPKPNLNFGMEFKLINSPGFLAYQNTNHSNLRFFSNYQGKRKRYGASFLLLTNKIRGAENGGIQSDTFLTSKNFTRRFTIPVNLGGEEYNDPSVFNPTFRTGTTQKDFTFFYRHYYDIGKKDSVEINDSTTEYLFYPKLRFQHTFTYGTYNYEFKDELPDSALYQNWYDTTLNQRDTLLVSDKWKIISNDFSLLQFPDTKNSGQYLMAGARLENITGTFTSGSKSFYNIVLHGEYRNKTRNKLWDILAKGEFYLNGLNSGDYNAYASLSRYLNKRWGNVSLLFNNVNRSPSFIYNTMSSFNFENTASYNKENIIILKATADNPFISLSAANYFITNYLFFSGYRKTEQYNKVLNLLQLSAAKKIRLNRRWNWYIEATLQQTDAAAPINLPLVYTRNRIAYEGLFFKNLNLSTGFEIRYYTPYKASNYSPVMGQFMPQDTATISNRPDINAFMNFRIKSFTGYFRAENLNTVDFTNGFGFTHNNFAAPHYIYPGLIIRFGIQWNFVN
jgi:Putative porin